MFTGIIEGTGTLKRLQQVKGATRLTFEHPFSEELIQIAASIAVNGCCLTAVDPTSSTFAADVSPETLRKTTLGSWKVGTRVNMERSLTPSSRMGGHFVTGHIDGLGELVRDTLEGGCWTMRFRVPGDLARYLATKGSIAIDGISLTVARVDGTSFDVAVIPTTREITTLSNLTLGSKVHLEMDVLAKYVEALMAGTRETLDKNFLASHGTMRGSLGSAS